MATAPVKSQPLHNFSLPCLKWGHKNQINSGNRFRRSAESGHNSPPTPPRSVVHVNASPSRIEADVGSKSKSQAQNRFSFTSCSTQNQEAVAVAVAVDGIAEGGGGGDDRGEKIFDADELSAKPWNLRPRKVVSKAGVEIGTAIPLPQSERHVKSMRLRGLGESHMAERRAKRKFWVALSREEVEEDVYAMTGLRPARRPKKRSKNVQKHVDNVFPGTDLVGVSASDYRVYETLG
ncbi:uncharacterized protein LOC124946195 [Impatiens glandulifera]|uniref:uncharacterized protein LOC124946195 n=1 Tax=Impatiens glandulifera TaxID=253017 RepID=UPI001FB140DE|nr:uncharacterized protein LOC124946195 [Impatiens glandulifera]